MNKIQLDKRCYSKEGLKTQGMIRVNSVGDGNGMRGVPEELTNHVRDCIFGIIGNGKGFSAFATWDEKTGECIWKQIGKDEDPKEALSTISDLDIVRCE